MQLINFPFITDHNKFQTCALDLAETQLAPRKSDLKKALAPLAKVSKGLGSTFKTKSFGDFFWIELLSTPLVDVLWFITYDLCILFDDSHLRPIDWHKTFWKTAHLQPR